MALAAQNRAADLWLEWNPVAFAAVVANYLEPFWGVFAGCSFFRSALGAALRRGHVPLIEHFLIFFAEEKGLFALNASRFNVRHLWILLLFFRSRWGNINTTVEKTISL